jgi:hypothetical protein
MATPVIGYHYINNNNPSSYKSYLKNEELTPEENQQKEEEEQALLTKCKSKAQEPHPQYPIRITYNNSIWKIDELLYDNSGGLIFVSSFDEAQQAVENDIKNEDSFLKANLSKRHLPNINVDNVRLSSANRSYFRTPGYKEKPDGKYDLTYIDESIPCWNIFISYELPSTISSARINNQNKGLNPAGGKKRRKTKKCRGNKSKKNRRSKKRSKHQKTVKK